MGLATGRREPQACREVRNLLSQWGACMGKMNPHTICLWKSEGPNSVSSYNQWDLNPRTLNISSLSSVKAQRAIESWVPALKEGAQQAIERQGRSSSLKNTRGKQGRELFIYLRIPWATFPGTSCCQVLFPSFAHPTPSKNKPPPAGNGK